MSSGETGACAACRRRGWLLAELSALLDYQRGRPERLRELLALSDEPLIEALGGRRRSSLLAAYRAQEPDVSDRALCRHDARYPSALAAGSPPGALYVEGEIERLRELLRAPVVAILGAGEPSEYGARVAAEIARGLAASGVTVATKLERGIASVAQEGAIRLAAGTLAVATEGLTRSRRGPRAGLCEAVARAGCVLSEMPAEACGRSWGSVACETILVGLATAVLLVEGGRSARDLSFVALAAQRGTALGAVPGRVDSPRSAGPHRLLLDGARLIRGAGDVLELLHEAGGATPAMREGASAKVDLAAPLQAVLAGVLDSRDTPAKLLAEGADADEVLTALGELEVAGLLRRTSGGRYIPSEAGRLIDLPGATPRTLPPGGEARRGP